MLGKQKLRDYLSSSFLHQFLRIKTGNLEQKICTDHWTANAIQLFVAIYIYIYIFCAIIFLTKSEQREIPQRLLDKCSSLFICMQWAETCLNPDIGTNSSYCNALIWTSLSSLKVNQQKPVDMVLYKQYTLTRSTTLFSRNHPELSVTQYLTVTSSNSQKQPPEVFYKKTCS